MDDRIEKLTNIISSFKKGSKIHIKKENRGKFTDYCGGKVTSECIARGKSSPNPAIRKRATFAANARKWKHENGGTIGFYKSGKLLTYSPFIEGEKPDNDSLVYKPMFQKTKAATEIEDMIYNNYQPSFPVEPVNINVPKTTVTEKPVVEQIEEISKPIIETESTSNNVTSEIKTNNPVIKTDSSTPKSNNSGKIYTSSEKEKFKQDMYDAYFIALKGRGLDDKKAKAFAERLTTQDGLESRWGRSELSKWYNFGGIKDFRTNVNALQRDTTEYVNGQKKSVSQPFRIFNDLNEYVNYKIDLVDRNWNVFSYNPEEYFTRILEGKKKYATDPDYASKLNNLHRTTWNLKRK